MNKYVKYIPSVILFLLIPILVIYPIWQITVGFSVFALFSFFVLKEFNKEEDNVILDKINKLEIEYNSKIETLDVEFKKLQVKTQELNNSLASLRMSKNNLINRG